MIDLRTEFHMITCNDSFVMPQKPEVEEVLSARPEFCNFTFYSGFSRTKLAYFTLYKDAAKQNSNDFSNSVTIHHLRTL
jgi:hypothetical protein